ncbi:hypothetical protein GCM10023224_04830 [Streptomonospora halophila]|uniref:Uncharacterized protein n=1 Tax=Streptomonospora halophila TaxID=427369 RepID=A0ABP9G5X1_9ACTN
MEPRPEEHVPRWRPVGSRIEWHPRPPEGTIIVLHRSPWRVVECREINPANWTDAESAAYATWRKGVPPEEWPQRPFVMVLDPLPTGKRQHGRVPGGHTVTRRWDVLDEHYPVCNLCQELAPCRHMTTEQEVSAGHARLHRMMSMTADSCWGCGEPITRRQKSVRFDGENLVLPGGPTPVRFHTRSRCQGEAAAYERAWLAADPGRVSPMRVTETLEWG